LQEIGCDSGEAIRQVVSPMGLSGSMRVGRDRCLDGNWRVGGVVELPVRFVRVPPLMR
jgi:hypothetical protein